MDCLSMFKAAELENTPTLATAKTAQSPFGSKDSSVGEHVSANDDEIRALTRSHETELIELLACAPLEAPMSPQSLKALKMLEFDPTLHRAVVTDTDSDPDAAVVAVAVRSVGVGEILVPQDRYDGLAVLALLERFAETPTIH